MSIRSAIIDFFKSGNGSKPIEAQSPIVYSADLDITALDGRTLVTKDMLINASSINSSFVELDVNTDVSFDSTVWGDSGLTSFQLYNKNPDFPNIDPNFGYWIGTTIVDRAFKVGRMEITFWDIELGKVTQKYERAKDDTKTTWGAWTKILTEADAMASPDLSGYAPLNSPAFTGNPTVPTASPGDNDITAASTAFVQEAISAYALFNYRGNDLEYFINKSGYYTYTGTGTTWNLPPSGSVPFAQYFIKNRGSGIFTIKTVNGENTIYDNSLSESISLNPGEAIILHYDGYEYQVQ